MLKASRALTDAENWSQFARNRIAEIAGRYRAVTTTHADNGVRLPKFLAALHHELSTPFDFSTRRVTISNLTRANEALKEAAARHEDQQPNPFVIAQAIEAAKAAITEFGTAKARDLAEFNDARASVERTARQLAALSAQLESMRGNRDSLPDARAFDEAERRIKGLTSTLQALQGRAGQAHTDWFALDDEVDALYETITRLLNGLRKEKEEGEAALQAITNARSKVRAARDYRGEYGITVSGTFGSSNLTDAERALANGDFERALRLAESASSQAKSRIEAAEDEVEEERRRRRRAAEAAAAARRAAEAASYRSVSSSSSHSSSSSYSFSSGISSSSFSGGFSSGVSSGKGW